MRLGRDPLRALGFDWRASLEQGIARLSEPLPLGYEHLVRPEPRGSIIQRFALPLELAPTTNRTRHSRPGQHEATKTKILALLRVQARNLRVSIPLAGRPQVLLTRFSSVEPDKYADWGKMIVDALCVPAGRRKDGLGLLRDDRPKDAEIVQSWEPAKRGQGFVFVEVRV